MKTKYKLRVLRGIIYRGGYTHVHCVQTGCVEWSVLKCDFLDVDWLYKYSALVINLVTF
jgi:hypothetical protein